MTLDPHTARYLEQLEAADITPYQEMGSAEEARAAYREVCRLRAEGGRKLGPPCSVEEFTVDVDGPVEGGVWVRVYRPLDRSVHDGPTPLVVLLHGGGWVLGDRDTHDGLARLFAGMPAVVVSVDYRLAPEHPYPAAHDDCWTAVRWAASTIGDVTFTDRLVIVGDSAGGLLAASMAQRCVEAGIDVAAQCLIYPAMDPQMSGESYEDFGEGYGLTKAAMGWFYESYAPGDGFSPEELDDLSALPPAVVATAGADVLRAEGLAYADRLRAAGVSTVTMDFPGLIHGFAGMAAQNPVAHGAVRATIGAVNGLLA